MMLAVTEAAADAINSLTKQDGGVGEQGGLRFTLGDQTAEGAHLAVALAPEPAQGDQVVKADDGAKVFLSDQAAEVLTDKVLDLAEDSQGQLNFAVRDR